MSLKQAQHVLVTGAAGDIGSAIVAHFVSSGATVTAVDIKSKTEILDRYTQEQQNSIKAVCLDLCDQKAVSSLINTGAPLTGVIGNAGVGLDESAFHTVKLVPMGTTVLRWTAFPQAR